MTLAETLNEATKPNVIFTITIGDTHIPVIDAIFVMWILMVIMAVLVLVLVRNFKRVPTGKQNVIETLIEFINKFVKEGLGHHWRPYAPWLGTIFLFLMFANIVSIFDIFSFVVLSPLGHGETAEAIRLHLYPPTKNINVTGCMAIMSILLVLFSVFRYKGPIGFLKSFITPSPIMVPFKILDYFTRPLSLALRLFGNILGAFIIMELIYFIVPVFIPAVFSIYFDLFDGIIQAFIFSYLTLVYVGEILE